LKSPYSPNFKLFALTYATSPNESITLSHRLLLNKKVFSQILQIQGLKQIEQHLGTSTLSPNDIVMAIGKYDRAAIGIVGLLSDYRIVRKRLAGYLNYWSQIKPHLTGADLIKIGVPKGPMMRLLLEQLRAGRLNGVIRTHKGEIDMIKFALAEMGNPSGIKPIRRNLRSAAGSKKDID
jgi:tRNA nucleotidyltransferase (CCA-adding enzyme)